jgi:gamma-glutamyltranspeptidase/glutathione hydrolase
VKIRAALSECGSLLPLSTANKAAASRRSPKMCCFIAFFLLIADSAWAGSQIIASRAALSTVSPLATQVGLNVLKSSGNAVDAAVAVAFALAVVHPQAGNLGGGGFLVYYESKSQSVWTLDFRETAPAAATREMYVTKDGSASTASRNGPLAAAVPATVAGLAAMHEKFGSRAWKELLQPSIVLASKGFAVDSTLTLDLVQAKKERGIDSYTSTAAIFYPQGQPLAAGSTLTQPDLAATLERMALRGPVDFTNGETSRRLVDAVRKAGGVISLRDLREYKPLWRAAVKLRFRDYDIYTMAPPSAGGIVMGEALNILSGFDLRAAGFQTPKAIHLFVESVRRAYLDRARYVGDPTNRRIPFADLLSPERARQWRASIEPARATASASLSEPETVAEGAQTTHFTIADEEGNIVALTTTLNENFGSGFVVPGCGFFLNNSMDDFTTAPNRPNQYGLMQGPVNAIEPGKRMTSSMSPVIILREGKPFLAMGTRGGPAIPTALLQVMLNVIVYGKSLADAIAAPRYHHQAYPDEIRYERDRTTPVTLNALNAMGHGVRERESIGDVHALQFAGGKIIAVADPRAGGAAGGY